MKRLGFWIVLAAGALVLSACNGSGSSGSGGAGNNTTDNTTSSGRHFMLQPGSDVTTEALRAFISARPGDVIEFACGYFDVDKTLLLTHTEAVTIKGCGKDQTVLSFRNSDGVEGILIDDARGITIQDLTVADTDGDAFVMRNVDHGTLDGVRAFWSSGGGRESADPIADSNYQDGRLDVQCTDPATQDPDVPENAGGDTSSPDYTVSDKSGRYGIYPVKSENILVENSESIGASDAGIYVGQTTTAIIRDSRSAFNVFGFEIENVRHGEYANNLAECNTGGFLVYDLDNLTRYGERTIMHDNISRMNNTYNFTEGGFVSNVPPGSGMITLSYDGIDVYDNQFIDNNTGGIIHTSYQIFPEGAGRPSDKKLDFYTEGMHVFRNKFRNNGNNLPMPSTTNLQNGDVAQVLPLAVGLKTGAACLLDPTACPMDGTVIRGAHILWDGYLPDYNPDCPYPTDANGDPIPEEEHYPGKPRFTGEDPQPDCHYNAYKFHTNQQGNPRRVPIFFASCIDDDNDFGGNSLTYSNFHGTEGLETAITLLGSDPIGDLTDPVTLQEIVTSAPQFPADLDMSPHDCEARFGKNLDRIPPVEIPPFVPSGEFDPAPSPEQVAEMCGAEVPAGSVNFDALAAVDCPRLDQYHLFADSADPTSQPNGPSSFPFVLNTKLFSDYSVKYRVAYLPPGAQMVYNEPGADHPTGALVFPLGTVIAKTFAFVEDGVTTPVETRLLIKRENSNGNTRWHGLPYVWQTDDQGHPIAKLQVEGATVSASWNYENVNTGERYQGSTDNYSVPTANQCLSCHANRDRPGGSAPIGPKVRNLNRPYESEVSGDTSDQSRDPIAGVNQIAYLCDKGWMTACPQDLGVNSNTQIAENLPRLPKYNVPGDAGFPAGSDEDVEARTRAWLEVNCQHCHNPQGFASNTGLFLDSFRTVDTSYGICKRPTATGAEGSGGRTVDIQPASASESIIAFRIGPEADTAAARMPPISRSVVNEYGHSLVQDWINNVVDNSYEGADACSGG